MGNSHFLKRYYWSQPQDNLMFLQMYLMYFKFLFIYGPFVWKYFILSFYLTAIRSLYFPIRLKVFHLLKVYIWLQFVVLFGCAICAQPVRSGDILDGKKCTFSEYINKWSHCLYLVVVLASRSSIYSGRSNTCSISYSNGSDNDW